MIEQGSEASSFLPRSSKMFCYNFHHFFFAADTQTLSDHRLVQFSSLFFSFFLFFFFLFVCVADKQTLSDHSTYIILWTPCTSYSAGRHSAVTDTQSQNTHTHSSTSGHNARALFENRFRFATVCLSADQVFLTTVRMQMTGYAN